MSTDLQDFDAWHDDATDATIPIKLAGKVWQVSTDAPAAVILRLQRLETAVDTLPADAPVPPELAADMKDLSYEALLRSMVGDQLVDDWVAAGVGIRALQRVSGRLYAYYTGQISADRLAGGPEPEPDSGDDGDAGEAGKDPASSPTS